jgi:hypothetical protein
MFSIDSDKPLLAVLPASRLLVKPLTLSDIP